MTRKNDIPTFNMKVVVQETGLTPDTLRAWERRYGMPSPERTKGGHRLYSQYEIDMLKWLIARQDEGLSISKAVDLWHQLKDKGDDPFETVPASSDQPPLLTDISGNQMADIRAAWLKACLNFDERNARHILAQAFAVFPMESVCFEIMQRGLNEIGQGWFKGTITEQQEHFSSMLAIRQLEALLASTSGAANQTGGRLVVACPPKEQHTFSPLLLALLLSWRGWSVVYLGADVPVGRLEASLEAIKPRLVILIAQTLYTAGTMYPMAALLRQKQVPLGFGGAVFSYLEDARARMPGYFLGPELPDVPTVIEELLHARSPVPEVKTVTPVYQAALGHYRNRRAAIEADLQRVVRVEGANGAVLRQANEELGNNIDAALTLGSMDLLTANMAWVGGLLVNYHERLPAEEMRAYVQAYTGAVKTHLDERGEPVRTWFERAGPGLLG